MSASMTTTYPSERLAAIETRLARIEVMLAEGFRERGAGSVYVVSDGAGRYKIGKATDAICRVKGIVTGNITATLVLAIETDNRHVLERELHRVYRKAGRHLGGEWYALAGEDVDALCALPSPLFEDEFDRVRSLRCSPLERTDPIAIGNGVHPTRAEALALVTDSEDAEILTSIRAGKTISQITRALAGGAAGGTVYQDASKRVLAVIQKLAKIAEGRIN